MKITVVGGFPMPVGGVTSFIYRLAQREDISEVIDLYPSRVKKIPPGYKGRYTQLRSYLGFILYNFITLRFQVDVIVHFNFSRTRSLVIFPWLYKNKKQRWVLMLHHGELLFNNKWLNKKKIFKKIDDILCINEAQFKFYVENGFPKDKCHICTSYVLPVSSNCNIQHKEEIDLFFSGQKPLLASGYPYSLYNHQWCIEFSRQNDNEKLALFLYGNVDMIDLIKKEVINDKNIMIFSNLDQDTFNYALVMAKVYLRPTMKDSFGIAVADAINYGVPVLASDVCPRYPGAFLFNPISYISFNNALKNLLNGNYLKLRVSDSIIDCFSYSKALKLK